MSGRRSVYESRTLGDRWRRLLGREKRPAPIALNRQGNPTYVVQGGRIVGVRDVNGELVRFPEPPVNPAEWPESWWGDEPEWIPLRPGRRQ